MGMYLSDTLVMYTSVRSTPAMLRHWSSCLPEGPTNGLPRRCSSLAGARPTTATWAPLGPSPLTGTPWPITLPCLSDRVAMVSHLDAVDEGAGVGVTGLDRVVRWDVCGDKLAGTVGFIP